MNKPDQNRYIKLTEEKEAEVKLEVAVQLLYIRLLWFLLFVY